MKIEKELIELSEWDCFKEVFGPELHDWTLYYDETNNPIIFKLDPEKFMGVNNGNMLFYDFILGGIALLPGNVPDFTPIKEILGITKGPEIKSSSLFKLTKGMNNLSDVKVARFLKMLLDNDVMIHFSSLNSLYDAAIEIVDDSFRTDMAKQYLEYHWNYKAAFYNMMNSNLKEFIEMLSRFGYPKVEKDQVNQFRNEVIRFINSHEKHSVEDEVYLQMIARNMGLSIDDNSDNYYGTDKKMIIIDSYSYNYLHSLSLFPRCKHIFDNEARAVDRFSKTEITYKGKPYKRYEFVDSKEYLEIQISDVLIKILSIVFYHIDNELDDENYLDSIQMLDNNQLKCLFYLNELIDRSINYNQMLIQYVLPYNLYERRILYLEEAAQLYFRRKMQRHILS